MYREYGTRRMFDDALGRATQEKLSQLRMAPGPHHDHIDIALRRKLDHDLRGISALDDNLYSKALRPQGLD